MKEKSNHGVTETRRRAHDLNIHPEDGKTVEEN